MDKSQKCENTFRFEKKIKKKNGKKTKQGTRIVGGDETDKAMPWMVKLNLYL